MLIPIKDDLFDICERLKEIDSGYFVVFNQEKRKFEVHSTSQNRAQTSANGVATADTYALTLPFDALDARAVDYVLKTQTKNAEKLLAEISRQNDSIEKQAEKSASFALEQLNKPNNAL